MKKSGGTLLKFETVLQNSAKLTVNLNGCHNQQKNCSIKTISNFEGGQGLFKTGDSNNESI